MELVFVRHALPVRADTSADGIADPPLSRLGERQSERLVNALRSQPLSGVTCSPALRAVGVWRLRLHGRLPDIAVLT